MSVPTSAPPLPSRRRPDVAGGGDERAGRAAFIPRATGAAGTRGATDAYSPPAALPPAVASGVSAAGSGETRTPATASGEPEVPFAISTPEAACRSRSRRQNRQFQLLLALRDGAGRWALLSGQDIVPWRGTWAADCGHPQSVPRGGAPAVVPGEDGASEHVGADIDATGRSGA